MDERGDIIGVLALKLPGLNQSESPMQWSSRDSLSIPSSSARNSFRREGSCPLALLAGILKMAPASYLTANSSALRHPFGSFRSHSLSLSVRSGR